MARRNDIAMRSLVLMFILIPLTGAASAQEGTPESKQARDQLRAACRPDFVHFCADSQPGGGRILACLREHAADLSGACRDGLAAMKAARAKAQQSH